MGGATFNRLHVWGTNDDVLATDLNAEFNNILNNLNPSGLDGYEDTVVQMQIQTSPGNLGSESLATSLGGEIERLRFQIQQIMGTNVLYWYQPPPTTLSALVAAIGSGLAPNRIVGGLTTGNSSQLLCFIPNGASASVVLTASTVNPLQYYINNVQYSITAAQTLSGLTLGPALANATAQITQSFQGTISTTIAGCPVPNGQQWTNVLGMYSSTISINNLGASYGLNVGKVCAFVEQGSSEFFLASVASSTATTTALVNAWRGCFWNSTPTLVSAGTMTTGDVVQMLQLTWIFANTNLSLAVTYDNPVISASTPSGAAVGDYWFNLNTTTWMTFNSTNWINASATLVGMCAQNTVACVAARTFNTASPAASLNTLTLAVQGTSQVVATNGYGQINVNGTINNFADSRPLWDFTKHMQSGFSISPSTTFYLYMKENGSPSVSPLPPLLRPDILGLYHPGEMWRCVGDVHCNASTQFETPARSFRAKPTENLQIGGFQPYFGAGVIQNFTWATGGNPMSMIPTNSNRFAFSYDPNFALNFTATTTAIATVSLTPGLWRVFATCQLTNLSVTPFALESLINNTVGTPTINTIFSLQNQFQVLNGSAAASSLFNPPPLFGYLNVTTATNYFYLISPIIGSAGYTISAAQAWFMAERVDDLVGDL